jgi:hypothetical protein
MYTASLLTNADSPTVVSLSKGEDGAVTLRLACGSVLTGIQAPVGWDGKTLPQARRALGKAGDARAQQVYLLAPWDESLIHTASQAATAQGVGKEGYQVRNEFNHVVRVLPRSEYKTVKDAKVALEQIKKGDHPWDHLFLLDMTQSARKQANVIAEFEITWVCACYSPNACHSMTCCSCAGQASTWGGPRADNHCPILYPMQQPQRQQPELPETVRSSERKGLQTCSGPTASI